jgi:hypothetical protein
MFLSGGLLFDEDIPVDVTRTATPGTLPYGQELGTAQSLAAGFGPSFVTWNASTSKFVRTAPMADRTIFPYTGANGLPQWNNQATGALTALTDQQFGVYWIIASNNVNNGISGQVAETIFVRPHNASFASIALAQAATVTALTWTNFPVAEFKVLYRVIFEARTAYTNSTHRCTVREVIDYRKSNLSNAAISSGTVSASSVSVSTGGFSGALDDSTVSPGIPAINSTQQQVNNRLDLFGFISNWNATDAALGYNVGNTVRYLGKIWRCLTANADATFTASKWEAIAIGFVDAITTLRTYSGNDGNLVYCIGNGTVYVYVAAGGALPADNGTTILDTGDAGMTKWKGLSGAFQYDGFVTGGNITPFATNTSFLGGNTTAWAGVYTLVVDTQSTTNTTLAIGTNYATVINIGKSGQTAINLYGTTTWIESATTAIVDKEIVLNRKAGSATSFDAGIGIDSSTTDTPNITKYIRTASTPSTEWVTQNGILLSNGGNTIGGTLTIGAKDAQIVEIVTGTTVKGISIATTGACTFGPATPTAIQHIMNGHLAWDLGTVSGISSTTKRQLGNKECSILFTPVTGNIQFRTGMYIGSADTNLLGLASKYAGRLTLVPTTNATDTMFSIGTFPAGTLNDPVGTETIIVTATPAGAWTFPVSVTAGSATLAANYPLVLTTGDDNANGITFNHVSTAKAYIAVNGTGVNVIAAACPQHSLSICGVAGIYFHGAVGTVHGSMSTTGAWTLGPAAYTGTHTVNGNFQTVFSAGISSIGGVSNTTSLTLGATGGATDVLTVTLPAYAYAWIVIINQTGGAGGTFQMEYSATTVTAIGTNTLSNITVTKAANTSGFILTNTSATPAGISVQVFGAAISNAVLS